jgi:hypothetical protein
LRTAEKKRPGFLPLALRAVRASLAFGAFLALPALLPWAAGARAAAPVCALLTEARVTGDAIYLSDLLPSGSSAALREAAGKISLGAAPPPGRTLTLEGGRIARALPAAARGEILVPPQVLVRRSGRLLSREEVLRAIQGSLRYNKLPGAESLDPDDVHFSAEVLVSAEDAKLKVRRADFDAALNQDRFLLVSAADPRALPFVVTVERRSAAPEASAEDAPGVRETALERALQGAPAAGGSSGEILVEPKKRARLHVVSAGMQMFLDVLPLEKGALHDTVRVKLCGSGRILDGEVVAAGRLEAKF